MPRYSIVIPTYKGFNKLHIVLDSLTRQSITKNLFEVILVFDGSTQNECQKIQPLIERYEELQITTIHLPVNLGPAVARNEGAKKARGDIIFFTDDDCEVPALWIETHLEMYKKYPQASAVGGFYRVPLPIVRTNVYEMAANLRYETYANIYEIQSEHNPVSYTYFPASNSANLSIKKYVFQLAQFNENFKAAGFEDIEFCRRLLQIGFQVIYIPQFVIHHKVLDLKSFLRLARTRGFGKYVNFQINPWSYELLDNSRGLNRKYINSCAEHIWLIQEHRKKLLFLNLMYSIISDSKVSKFWYRHLYRKHLALLGKYKEASSNIH